MRKTGQSLAADAARGRRASATVHGRAKEASAFLNDELGAITRVVRRNGGFVIEGDGCPLAAITDSEPAVCVAIESMLRTLVGVPVRECCQRDGRPRCCFEIRP